MLEIIAGLFGLWILWGFIKFTFKATWGLLKLVGILLSIVAFPMVFIGLLAVGIGAYLALPLVLIGLAFSCVLKA